MAWYRNAACMASRTVSLPRKENERLLTPPVTLARGKSSLISRVASMKVEGVVVVLLDARGHGEHVGVEDDVLGRHPDFSGQ